MIDPKKRMTALYAEAAIKTPFTSKSDKTLDANKMDADEDQ